MPQQAVSRFFSKGDAQHLIIGLRGDLDIHSISEIWRPCFNLVNQNQPKKLTLDLSELIKCDSSAISLINALKQYQTNNLRQCQVINANTNIEKLLSIFSEEQH